MSSVDFGSLEEWLDFDDTQMDTQYTGGWAAGSHLTEEAQQALHIPGVSRELQNLRMQNADRAQVDNASFTNTNYESSFDPPNDATLETPRPPSNQQQHSYDLDEKRQSMIASPRATYATVVQRQSPERQDPSNLRYRPGPRRATQEPPNVTSHPRVDTFNPTPTWSVTQPQRTYAQAVAGPATNIAPPSVGDRGRAAAEQQIPVKGPPKPAAHRGHSSKRARTDRAISPESIIDAEIISNNNYRLGTRPVDSTATRRPLQTNLMHDAPVSTSDLDTRFAHRKLSLFWTQCTENSRGDDVAASVPPMSLRTGF
ncbi:hypothetical protein LTR85_011841 [Meristemomyces frigidus]|nr:hypothetical protein LTR85_011841 [Meristemomyces frigidus]